MQAKIATHDPRHEALVLGVELRRRQRHQRRHRLGRRARHLRRQRRLHGDALADLTRRVVHVRGVRRVPELRRQGRRVRRHVDHRDDHRRARLVGLREPRGRRRVAAGDRGHQQGDDDEGRRYRDQPLDGVHEGERLHAHRGGRRQAGGRPPGSRRSRRTPSGTRCRRSRSASSFRLPDARSRGVLGRVPRYPRAIQPSTLRAMTTRWISLVPS